ncbi:MAG TPA: hypothetical protein VGO55_16655 [Allosphingosinicella sp.]|jgi:outer membrane immunogenic protein|nr:hypothetical protein [Allosphingosinicella sp.]
MRVHCIALLFASALATPAFAQDEPEATITPAPAPSSMSGFRVEALLGWDHTEILDDDQGGVLYGVGIGYDFQVGRAVLSIEAEANDSTNDGCLTGLANANDRLCITSGRPLCRRPRRLPRRPQRAAVRQGRLHQCPLRAGI